MIHRALIVLILASHIAVADSSTAERLFVEGQTAFDARQYDAALQAWSGSYELSREPGLLFNIGQAYRLRAHPGDCARAVTSYRAFVAGAPASAERTDAEAFLVELAKCTEPPNAEPARVEAKAEPAPHNPGRRKRLAGIAATSGGAVLVVTGILFGRKASRLADEVSAACAETCNWNELAGRHDEGRSAARTQWLLYGIGAAAAIGGGVTYYLGSRERSRLTVTPAGGGAAIAWSGSW